MTETNEQVREMIDRMVALLHRERPTSSPELIITTQATWRASIATANRQCTLAVELLIYPINDDERGPFTGSRTRLRLEIFCWPNGSYIVEDLTDYNLALVARDFWLLYDQNLAARARQEREMSLIDRMKRTIPEDVFKLCWTVRGIELTAVVHTEHEIRVLADALKAARAAATAAPDAQP